MFAYNNKFKFINFSPTRNIQVFSMNFILNKAERSI